MAEDIITVKNVSKSFAPRFALSRIFLPAAAACEKVPALCRVSFTLREGSISALLGSNGAGKTTLLKLLASLLIPDEGNVLIKTCDTVQHGYKIKRSIGFCSCDERSFYWRLTGRQNLSFFATLHGLSAQDSRQRIDELCATFGVSYADRRFDSYSSGMKQVTGLMRALLHKPDILLLDEPFKGLDIETAQRIRSFLGSGYCPGRKPTIIFSTHQMGEPARFADHALILRRGRLLAAGSLIELQKQTALSASSGMADIYKAVIAAHPA